MKRRHRRIAFIIAALACIFLAGWLVSGALRSNLVFFLSPSEVAAHQAPPGRNFRVGGLVEEGTWKRDPDGLTHRFIVTDTAHNVPVVFKGHVPDLFKEGKGCVAEGRLGSDGVFYADTVMAKHDENYMPPEAGQALDKAKHAKDAAKTVVEN